MRRRVIGVVGVICFLTGTVRAQENQGVGEAWLQPRQQGAVAAAQMVVIANPLTAAAMRVQGHDLDLWDEPPSGGTVPALSLALLASVRDDQAFGNWEQAMPWEIPADARDEDLVYWKAIRSALKTPVDIFAQASAPNRHLTFGHLYSEPAHYRGRVVHMEGRLVRLKQLEPPRHAQAQGIRVLYEAWIYLDQPGTHPLCAILAHKPSGIEPGDGLNRRVTLDGYFFKRYRYISGRFDGAGNNLALNTVLLIAPTVALQQQAVPTPSVSFGSAWPWLGGFAASAVVLMLAITWWFRHNDRQVQTRLQSLHAAGFPGAAFDVALQFPKRAGQ